ncbi:DUF6933 domain-containing protein [Miniphocaeibacter halophilus]|uniref:Uncharacterized protein n=1 Tax=Miniphocaeibacter halophilus TaxID=2931922 RepID=A0AC61MSG4_9FIRM|nr:hypothetical protein [Miniphocaeibacter halophilus]QQK08417.1 hypothetical protein JFY71_02455 [Miniphocaeibacter halophilus]
MIIYATKQTFERYNLKYPKELSTQLGPIVKSIIKKESGDKILEWGAKLFYFDRRKCIQVVNFASKLTLFLIDIKVADIENIGDLMVNYLFELYKKDKLMIKAIEKLIEEHPIICFEKLIDKSIIATLNETQRSFAEDGYRFFDFIEEGILNSIEINRQVNFDWIFSLKINEKKEYIYAGEKFRELLLERYYMV